VSGMNLVAIVDDEESVRVGLGSLMRSADVNAELFSSAETFLQRDPSRFALVLSDLQMPGRSGLDLLATLNVTHPQVPVILMTAFPDERIRQRASAAGAYRFLVKPCDPDEIINLVEGVLGTAR
jgi:FixJ family two-component response regulator